MSGAAPSTGEGSGRKLLEHFARFSLCGERRTAGASKRASSRACGQTGAHYTVQYNSAYCGLSLLVVRSFLRRYPRPQSTYNRTFIPLTIRIYICTGDSPRACCFRSLMGHRVQQPSSVNRAIKVATSHSLCLSH